MKRIFDFRFLISDCQHGNTLRFASRPARDSAKIKNLSAFTILELLIATVVLTMMLVLLLQIATQTLQASRVTTQQLNATQSARSVLDALSNDIVHAVTANGATILCQPGNPPVLAMLTTGRGPSGGSVSRFLGLTYRLSANHEFTRGYSAVPYTTTELLDAAVALPTGTSILSKSTLQFTVLANLEDGTTVALNQLPASAKASGVIPYQGHTVPTGWTALVPATHAATPNNPRIRSLLIAIAVVDEQNLDLLASKNQLPTFSQPASDPVGTWQSELAGTSRVASSSIRFYSQVIPLP